MDAIEVYSVISTRLRNSQFAGEVNTREIEAAIKLATRNLINRVWVKEDMKFQSGRGISGDERLANILAGSLKASVVYEPDSMIEGNRYNSAPHRPNSDIRTMLDYRNYGVGFVVPSDFMFPHSVMVDTTNDFLKKKVIVNGATVTIEYYRISKLGVETIVDLDDDPTAIHPNYSNSYRDAEIRYLDNIKFIALDDYAKIRHNIFQNPYSGEVHLIPVGSLVNGGIDGNGLPQSIATNNFRAHGILNRVPIEPFDGSRQMMYWVMTGRSEDVVKLTMYYFRNPEDFHIDLEIPENSKPLRLHQSACDIIIEMAIEYLMTSKFPDGDKLQLIKQGILDKDIATQP